MPRRKATAKEKASPQVEASPRPKRQSAKQASTVASPASGERRSRRSSTAAQTAASVAEATRVTRSSQGSNRTNSSDRKSTSREPSLEPSEPRSSRRIIKKINYQESEGDDEDSQAKKVEKEVEEEDYNAEEDVENDSDSGDIGRNKVAKGKMRSPPSRVRVRSQRVQAAKEESPTKVSPRGRRPKTESKLAKSETAAEENEADFVAPMRKGRFEEEPEEKGEETRGGKARTSSRSRPTRAAKQVTTTKTTPQRPTRTSRRQQNMAKAKEEEELEDKKKMLEEEKVSDEEDEMIEESEKAGDGGQTPKGKRKAGEEEESPSRKRQKTEEAKSEDDDEEEEEEEEEETEANVVEKEDSSEEMEVDECDEVGDYKGTVVPTSGEAVDKKVESKLATDLPKKEEAKPDESKKSVEAKEHEESALVSKHDDPTSSKSFERLSKPAEEEKPAEVIAPNPPKVDEKVAVKDTAKDQQENTVENQMDLSEEKEKIAGVGEPADSVAPLADRSTESDSKSKEPQQNSVNKEGTKCSTFNGCETAPEKAAQDSVMTQDQAKPSIHLISAETISNSLGMTAAKPEKESPGANGVHCNQNRDSKPHVRKYVFNGSVKEDERLSCKDRTFGFVSCNMSGDSMQAMKALLEVISHQNGIVCLQDVSEEFYRSHLKSSFESQGYKVVFHVPAGQKSGFATLYKATLFTLKQQKGISLKDVIIKDMEATFSSPEDRSAVNCHLKNCGHALLTHFMFNDRLLTVANSSIPPNDLATHTLQMSCVAREALNFFGGANKPLLICGTFNMQESTAPYQVLRDGYLGNDMIELLQSRKDVVVPGKESRALINLLWKSFQHSAASLESCYATVMGSELKTHGKNTTVPDLMWFGSDCLKMLGVLGDVESPEQSVDAHTLLKADLAFSN